MSHPVGLLDTSTVVLLAELDETLLPDDAVIASVTLAELSVGPLVARDDLERARRQRHVQQAEDLYVVVPFDAGAARAFGQVSASLRERGRTTAARAFDALIAATAIAHRLPVYTVNPRDFEGIDGLEVVALPHPGA